jgi:cellulase
MIEHGGTAKPPGTFAFVGGYTHDGPGILYNTYGGLNTYPIPGPQVWDGTGGTSSNNAINPGDTNSKPNSTDVSSTDQKPKPKKPKKPKTKPAQEPIGSCPV